MERSFHYNATYYAANLAGFNKTEANIIASASLYVDDHHSGLAFSPAKTISIKLSDYKKYEFYKVPTGMEGILAGMVNDEFNMYVWPMFHFLPGNYSVKYPYNNSIEHKIRVSNGNPKEDLFKMLNRPNSTISTEMVNHTVDYYDKCIRESADINPQIKKMRKNIALLLIGVRAHVLADTFAHQDFVGLNDPNIGDVLDLEYSFAGKWDGINYQPEDDFKKISWASVARGGHLLERPPATPRGIWSSLGHAQAGHFPDMAFAVFHYVPSWIDGSKSRSGKQIRVVHNNPEIYLRAFYTLYQAFKCIKHNSVFRPLTEEMYLKMDENLDFSPNIKNAISIPSYDKYSFKKWEESRAYCERHWDNAMAGGYGCPMAPGYLGPKWSIDSQKVEMDISSAQDSMYIMFNIAAKVHVYFLISTLNKFGIKTIYDQLRGNTFHRPNIAKYLVNYFRLITGYSIYDTIVNNRWSVIFMIENELDKILACFPEPGKALTSMSAPLSGAQSTILQSILDLKEILNTSVSFDEFRPKFEHWNTTQVNKKEFWLRVVLKGQFITKTRRVSKADAINPLILEGLDIRPSHILDIARRRDSALYIEGDSIPLEKYRRLSVDTGPGEFVETFTEKMPERSAWEALEKFYAFVDKVNIKYLATPKD